MFCPPQVINAQTATDLLRDSTTDQSGTQTKTHASCVQGGNSVKTLLGGVLSNVDV